jgi:L-gulonolactone oxidase
MPRSVVVHDDRTLVTVGAGVRLRQLSAVLARAGLSLPIVGSIQSQSVAGAIATGTHGSSLRYGNLSSLVTAMRLVDGAGSVVQLSAGDERLDAARVHLGALGVVTSVTLPVRPARRLRQLVENVPVETVPDRLVDIASSAEYVKVWWLPHARNAQVIRYDETTDPPTRRPSVAAARWLDEQVSHRSVFPMMTRVQRRRPQLTAGLAEWLSARYLGREVQVGADMMLLNTPMPLRHRETEAALPLSAAPAALADVLRVFRAGRPAVLFPLEVRFVRGDQGWLSPAYGADTCQIGAYAVDCADCTPYFDAFWGALAGHPARPHWGKEMSQDAAFLRPRYPRYDDFVALRDALDPGRVFGGSFHRRILGP